MAPAPGLLLWLLLLGSLWCFSGQRDPSPGRRFLDLKICADEECSMLMYRAKALVDFTGPDCRFMSCKKGEHVHVYYRLAGGSPEVRAGSVGQIFVYFPKDFIKVLHKYTEKELYVPADDDSLPEEVPRQGVKSPEGAQGTELDPPPEPELGKSDSGEREEVQPPQQDNSPQENTGDLSVPLPEEPGLLHQAMTGYLSASEVSQKSDTEKDVDPGFLVTEDSPVGAADAEKLLETGAEEPVNIPPPENALSSLYSCILYISKMLIATLPDNVQPGPDFYGLPWQPVIVTAILGIVSFAIFSWRTILVVKSRVYQVTEKQIYKKLENIKKENVELTEKWSDYEQKIKEYKKYLQDAKKENMILSDEAIKYTDKIKILKEANAILSDKAKSLHLMLESEREQNFKNQGVILEKKKSIEKLKDVISMDASELSEVQSALQEAMVREEDIKSEWDSVEKENGILKEKKEQLQQQIEEGGKLHAELTEQIKSLERSQKDLEVALTHKDDIIKALTNCITQLNLLECELESEDQNEGGNESDELANGEVGGDRNEKIKNRIKRMMDVSWTQTAVSVVEEDLKLLQLKLKTSMSTKCNLEDQIKKLEDDHNSLQTTKAELEEECQTLRQKVEVRNELYQQWEIALQRKLSQEEYERQDREQRLSAADEKVALAAEEVKTYKRRIKEMEEELEKTERSFKNQIAAHEKKAHDNWLKARAAERAMSGEKREAAYLKHKLLEVTQKMAMRQDEPVIVKPMPGRPNTQNPPRRGSLDRHLPRPRRPSEASGKHSASDPGPAPAKATDEGKVNMAPKRPPPFPGVPFLGGPLGGPIPPPIRYGPPPQLCGPFGPWPVPPPFVAGMRPPVQFPPGTRLPPPTHGPQDYPLPPPAAREEAPPASSSSVQDHSPASKPSP